MFNDIFQFAECLDTLFTSLEQQLQQLPERRVTGLNHEPSDHHTSTGIGTRPASSAGPPQGKPYNSASDWKQVKCVESWEGKKRKIKTFFTLPPSFTSPFFRKRRETSGVRFSKAPKGSRNFSGRSRAQYFTLYLENKDVFKHETLLFV